MAFSPEKVLAHPFPAVRQAYAERDAILYALGVGLGRDPCDAQDLRCLDEQNLHVLPTFATTLASPGMWVRDPSLEIAWVKLVHLRQSADFMAALPPAGAVVSQARIDSVTDYGAERGAEVVVRRVVADAESGTQFCAIRQTLLLRGNGGFSNVPAERPARWQPPARAPDATVAFSTSTRAALIYRLSGDWKPRHVNPDVATEAGFSRPILHGLAAYGVSGWVIVKALARGAPSRLRSLGARFASPILPGDTIVFALWQDAGRVVFEARVGDRIVLDGGDATLAP